MVDYSARGHIAAVGHALTQLFNALLGSCDSHESFSERAYHNRFRPRWRTVYRFINALAWRESDHCRKAHIKRLAW